MEPLRVGIDIRALQSAGGSAERGIGRYVTDLVVGLRDHAPEIEPVLFGLSGRIVSAPFVGLQVVPVEGPIFAEAPRPWFGGIPKLRSSSALWGARHRKLRAELAAGMTQAVAGANLDVLHFPSAVDVGSYPEGEFIVPQVRTFLDAIPLRKEHLHYGRWPAFMQAYYREQLAHLGDAAVVVAISNDAAADAHRFGRVPEARIQVVYPSVSDRYRDPDPGPPPFDLVPQRYVLFCSVPDAHKNPDIAIKAFALANLGHEYRLVLVCPLERPEVPQLRQLAAERGIAHKILITGHIPEDAMPALFAHAFALISPSEIEGFGLPAAQAMAAGTPVLAARGTALGEIVGGAGVLAGARQTQRYANKLRRLAEDRPFRDRLRAMGRARARRFTPQGQARALAAVYFEAAGRSSVRPSE